MSDKDKVKRYKKILLQQKIQKHNKLILSKLVKFDYEKLKQKSVEVTKNEDISFINDMIDLLNLSENGVGLAAPQINVFKRVIIVDSNKIKRPTVMINPVIESYDGNEESGEEGCLSFPGIYLNIKRWTKIKVSFFNSSWVKEEKEYSNFEARVIQHEIDHLNGVCLVGEEFIKTTS